MNTSSKSLTNKLSQAQKSAVINRIVYLRRDVLHLSQDNFAKHLNISQTLLSMYENQTRPINDSFISQLSSVFCVNLEWLIYGIGDDDNIFIDKSLLPEPNRTLDALCAAYQLTASDMKFISWYLNLSPEARTHCSNFISSAASLYKEHPFGS